MRTYCNVLMLSLILALCLSGCGKSYIKLDRLIRSNIPKELHTPTQPPLKATEPMTIEDGLNMGFRIRVAMCVLYTEYGELLRHATGGETELKKLKKDRCPKE